MEIKSKILGTLLITSLSLTNAAEYSVKVMLEPRSIEFDSAEVNGKIELNPNTINRGEKSLIQWDYTFADQIRIEDIGTYNNKSGSVEINPLTSRSYNVEVTNGDKKRNEVLNLTVIQPSQEIDFSINPNRIGIGQSAVLDWNVKNADSVQISNINTNLNLDGTYTVSPSISTSYTITAKGYEGINDLTKSINLEVVPNSIINSFSVNKNKITQGDSAIFSWNVSNAESLSLNPFGSLTEKNSGTQNIIFNTVGNFDYTLESTSLSGVKVTDTKSISVYAPATITDFKVNNTRNINVSPNDDINFTWITSSSIKNTLNGTEVTGTSSSLKAKSETGSTTYTLQATNGADDSVTDNVIVNVIGPSIINSFNAPTTVFTNSPITLSWNVTGANKYTLKSNSAESGISTTEEDLGLNTTKVVTPNITANKAINYILTSYNIANAKTERTAIVNVENNPTFTNFTVNGQPSITVSPNTVLSFEGIGFSSGAVLQGRNSSNTNNEGLPQNASSTAGTTTYYASATKTLNNLTRNSDIRSVSVTVVNNPAISNITAPSTVFSGTAFTMSWTGSNVSNYKIKSNNSNSGIPTTDVDLGTSTSRAITPTSSGTYNYTITATNAANVVSSSTITVVVEGNPTFTSFTVNGGTTINVSPATALSFASSGFSSGSVFQARNSSNNSNDTLPSNAPTTFGSYNYYGSAVKSLNGQTLYSALRTVTVNVVENWTTIEPTYTAWANNGAVTGCSVWTPSPSTVTVGQSFTQTRSCSQAQTRTRQNREQENYTKEIRNVGTAITENNSITVSQSQTATGTKETWVATTPTYTAWVNSGSPTGCSTWTPDASTENEGTTFTQTRSCTQTQTRTRQDREQETTTGSIRNISTTVESQNIPVGESKNAIGTKSVITCYTNNTSYRYYRSSSGSRPPYYLIWDGVEVSRWPANRPFPLTIGEYTYSIPSTGTLCRQQN